MLYCAEAVRDEVTRDKMLSRHLGLSALAMCLMTMLAACAGGSMPDPTGHNVVLITVDTLRADHCSVYGYDRETTPFLAELARHATVFDHAYANSSWTAPSMASLFTSLPPRAHGVTTGFFRKGEVTDQDYLSDDFDTLTEVLARHGYETFGVSTNAHLTASTGFAQGFDALTELWWKAAPEANAEALRFRDRLEAADRYFLWVHYFDPHHPYEAREPWFSTYQRMRKDPQPEVPNAAAIESVLPFGEEMSKYDSEIRYVDASIQQLLEALVPKSDALVIVTSDHGEAFFEHGNVTHGQTLFDEEIRVPLIIRAPGQLAAQRIDSRVSLLDVYPTILDLLGIEIPGGLAGASVAAAAAGSDRGRAVVAELDRKRTEQSFIWQNWKLYRGEKPRAFVRLYDLQHDPDERRDLAADHAPRIDEMSARLAEWQESWPRAVAPRKAAPVTEQQLERLRALGYL